MDIVHGFSGHCPWSQRTLSMDWVDNVHGLSGHCPWTVWTLSMGSVDIVHLPILQPNNVHGLSTDRWWQNQQMTSAPSSAWASAQSDQSLCCVLNAVNGYLRTLGSFLHADSGLIRLGRCPGWSESSLGAPAILLVLSCCGSSEVSDSTATGLLVSQWQ